jgi:subtilase family serine protease
VITQSFGATEETFPSKQSIFDLRSAFLNARRHHVTVLASSGDTGATNFTAVNCCYPFPVNSWPSADPLVTSIGGTQLHLDADGNRIAPDEVWNDGFGATGGGISHVFSRPDFQDDQERLVGDHRGTPDISMSAAVDGGVDVYYSFIGTGWHVFGGTSESSPIFAGIVALADQLAGHRLGFLNEHLYKLEGKRSAGIVDVRKGNNSLEFIDSTGQTVNVVGFAAGRGYDLASGWGTIDAARFVPALAGGSD